MNPRFVLPLILLTGLCLFCGLMLWLDDAGKNQEEAGASPSPAGEWARQGLPAVRPVDTAKSSDPVYRSEIRIPKGNRQALREDLYDGQNRLVETRIFKIDRSNGRVMNAVVYNGKGKPRGSFVYFYHPKTGALLREEKYNQNGQKVLELYHPGALHEPRYAGQTVAFRIDPKRRRAARERTMEEIVPFAPGSAVPTRF